MEGYTGRSSRLSKAFLPLRCLALSFFFFLQDRRWWPDELLAGILLAVQRRGVEQSVRKAECLPGDAESGDEFIGFSLRDVPSSGFSDSLSDLNTH